MCRYLGLLSVLSVIIPVLVGCAGNLTVSEDRYQRALKLVDQGTANIRLGKLKEANLEFQMAEELAPLAAAVDGQGCVALLSGDLLSAEKLLLRAYEMDEDYDHALANLALLFDIQGRYKESKELYDRAIERFPDWILARNNRAALEYDRSGGKMEAISELKKSEMVGKHHVVSENLRRLN